MYLISTTQRCGSTWLARILKAMTVGASAYVDCSKLGFSLNGWRGDGAVALLRETLISDAPIQVFKTHDIPSRDFDAICAEIPRVKIVTVRRDFRDVVVSRYFYYRYYWPSEPKLGPLPEHLRSFLSKFASANDSVTLSALIESAIAGAWAKEWAAFETPFTHPRALRVSYEGLLDGRENEAIARFANRPFPNLTSFDDERENEKSASGRRAQALFNREGRYGQWNQWFTPEQAAHLNRLAASEEKAAALHTRMSDSGLPS